MRAPDAIGPAGGILASSDRRQALRPALVGIALAEDGRIRVTRLFTADRRVAAPR